MEEKHIGSLISVDCGDGSYFQGKLTAVDGSSKNITIANAFKEGVPLGKCVTIQSSDIVSLKVLKPPANATNAGTVAKKQPVVEVSKISKHPQQQQPHKLARSPRRTPEKAIEGTSSILDKLFINNAGVVTANNIQKKNRKGGVPNNQNHVVMTEKQITTEIAETPAFRTFERQVPHPTDMSKISNGKGAVKGCNRKQGPSGIPLLDALNCYQGKYRRNKNNLEDLPLDFDLESDFDFDENLKLFSKEDRNDDDYYENVEKLKISQNFAHYENIVDDADRVISWTSVKSRNPQNGYPTDEEISNVKRVNSKFSMSTINYEKSAAGQPVPAVSSKQKDEYLKACSDSMNEMVFDTVTADRLFSWICDVQERHGDVNGTLVLLASAKNSVRFIRRILTNLDKRMYNCHLFGKYPGEEFDCVTVVNDVRELPKSPIICLLSQDINDVVEGWLKTQTSSHLICVENVPTVVDPAKVHLLMYGCATSGLRHVSKKILIGNLCLEHLGDDSPSTFAVDSAVADIGSPTNWFDETSKQFISTAFSTTFLVKLSSL